MNKTKKRVNFGFVKNLGNKPGLLLLFLMMISVSCTSRDIQNNSPGMKPTIMGLDDEDTPFEIQATGTVINTNDENKNKSEISERNSPDNLKEIQEIARIDPYHIPYFQISADGRIIAVGAEQKIYIMDGISGEVITEIPANPIECNYGMGRYFRINENGAFIGILNNNFIEIWQVGGGKIHETEFIWQKGGDRTSCSGYIPEISISPDGELLAVSGKEYKNNSPKQIFRVIDIPQNHILYEWDGKEESLHGNLYTYPGLGFSADGKFIQTFDPKRFTRSQNDTHGAFRFWQVGNWIESSAGNFLIRESFQAGNLNYSMSSENNLEVRDRLDGKVITRFDTKICSFEYPCETKFSLDGRLIAVLSQKGNRLFYGNQTFFEEVEIWDIEWEKKVKRLNGLFRNLDGIHPDYPERSFHIEKWMRDGENGSLWWISEMYFEGLKKSADGKIYFVPRESELENEDGYKYRTNCQLDSLSKTFICKEGLFGFAGQTLKIDIVEGIPVLMIQDEKLRIVGELPFINSDNSNQAHFRLLGFSEKYQTGFFCMDENFREQQCIIYDFIDREPLYEIDEIKYFRNSPDGETAAFVNTVTGRLFIFHLEENKIEEKTAYQSRAASVNPVFNSTSTLIYYLVQNLDNLSNFSFDAIDLSTGKVLKRTEFEEFESGKPTAFAVNNNETIWAVGSDAGEVKLTDSSDGSVICQWLAHMDGIVGIEFSSETGELFTIGQNGIIKIWDIGN